MWQTLSVESVLALCMQCSFSISPDALCLFPYLKTAAVIGDWTSESCITLKNSPFEDDIIL